MAKVERTDDEQTQCQYIARCINAVRDKRPFDDRDNLLVSLWCEIQNLKERTNELEERIDGPAPPGGWGP